MKYLFTFFFLVVLSAAGNAQISIDFPDFIAVTHDQNSIQTFAVPFVAKNPSALESLVGKGDTNVTWDLTLATYTRKPQAGIDTSMVYPSGAALANDPEFTPTNLIIKNFAPNAPTKYSFFQFTNEGIFDVGITEDSFGIASKIISYNPPLFEARIPMRFDSTWESSSRITGVGLKPGESRVMSIKAKVDAWGQVQLPQMPYQLEALRVKKQIIVFDSMNGVSVGTDTTFQYYFCGNNIFSVTVTTDSRNVITNAEYAAPIIAAGVSATPADGFDFVITPNPASNAGTKILYTMKNEGNVQVALIDMLGNRIRMLQDGFVSNGRHVIDVDQEILRNGVYFIRLVSPEVTVMRKLVVSR